MIRASEDKPASSTAGPAGAWQPRCCDEPGRSRRVHSHPRRQYARANVCDRRSSRRPRPNTRRRLCLAACNASDRRSPGRISSPNSGSSRRKRRCQLHFQAFNADGSNLGTEQALPVYPFSDVRFCALTNGGGVAVREDGTGDIYQLAFTSDGDPIGSSSIVTSFTLTNGPRQQSKGIVILTGTGPLLRLRN